ncbi:two-component sensor histidine kinase [Prauserella marina]|uniref:sensor histidine kinase n=1 Tax=Prauserella marina TaxID=530584 RepID=UPI000B8D676E|nr:sensor histidine kinase [Prauserella marina]ASR37159.1 two-component sensor histidine kinase [Prauserella marina]
MTSDCGARPAELFLTVGADSRWRRLFDVLQRWLPILLLGFATVSNLALEGQTWGHRWETLGLVAIAAVLVLLTDTFVPDSWRHPLVSACSFTVLLASASVLMHRDLIFLAFMITGFFRAITLRPRWVMLLGLVATSMLINGIGSGGVLAALSDWPYTYLLIVVVQSGAIAGGYLMAERVVLQNEQRREALAELESALEENAGLHQQLLAQAREAGVLDERQRLSREIHDTLAQGFTGIITQLQAAQESGADPAERQRHLAAASALARENLDEARRAVHALSPEALEGKGLPDALAGIVSRWSERVGVPAEFTTTGAARSMHPEIEATLLRITQEALTNVAKHAEAHRVGLTLSYMEDQVTLDVRDDGRGFDPQRARTSDYAGFGLAGMRHRLRRLAGTLAVETEPGGGTAVSASLPAVAAPGLGR